MIGLTACWQKSSTFTHGMLRGRGGGLCWTDLTVHFALDRSQNTFHLAVWLKAWKRGRCRAVRAEIHFHRQTDQRAEEEDQWQGWRCRNSFPLLLLLWFTLSSLSDLTTNSRPTTEFTFSTYSIFQSRHKGRRKVIYLKQIYFGFYLALLLTNNKGGSGKLRRVLNTPYNSSHPLKPTFCNFHHKGDFEFWLMIVVTYATAGQEGRQDGN